MNKEHLRLLKKFEPILRFTKGEKFFPFSVEQYVENSSAWVNQSGSLPKQLYKEGDLNIHSLPNLFSENPEEVTYLKFADPLNVLELTNLHLKSLSPKNKQAVFHAGLGRLARVGYNARILDALFSLTLLLRGRVPGDAAAAAALKYQNIQAKNPQHCYYGRVVKEKDWLTLQYWYFYAFNDWRSGYSGLNDHEGDWEMVNIYLHQDSKSEWRPAWTAYASHDFEGGDLRRRWDDIERVENHPVIYVGAGSHSSYYEKGDYMAELVIPLLSPLFNLSKRMNLAWRKFLGAKLPVNKKVSKKFFHIPFIDYARGDGRSIGFNQAESWDKRHIISEDTDWVKNYRGLWGLWTNDPVMRENAPRGPMYDRFGKIRRAWYDPLGWAGVTKLTPPNIKVEMIKKQQQKIQQRQQTMEEELARKTKELRSLNLELEVIKSEAHLGNQARDHQHKIELLSKEIAEIRLALNEDRALSDAMSSHAAKLKNGYSESAREHLHRPQTPTKDKKVRFMRIAETWSAVSIGLALVTIAMIITFFPQYLLLSLIIFGAFVVLIEAIFRLRVSLLFNLIIKLLVIIIAGFLIYKYSVIFFAIMIFMAGLYIIWENLHELWR